MQIKKVSTIVNVITSVIRSYIKPALYIIIGLFLLYGFIYLITKERRISDKLQTTIDSLNNINATLTVQRNQIDSAIEIYNTQIEVVSNKINDVKEKTIIIREYYNMQSRAASRYTPTQVDSFFKRRYGY